MTMGPPAATPTRTGLDGLRQRLGRLATAACMVSFAGAVAAKRLVPPSGGAHVRSGAEPLVIDARLIREIRQLLRSGRFAAADLAAVSTARATIDTAVSEIDLLTSARGFGAIRTLADGTCLVPGEPAAAFLSTGVQYQGDGDGALVLDVTGSGGSQTFAFASGTAQAHIITALNGFTQTIGVSASVDRQDDNRIQLSSTEVNADGFVRVRQIAGPVDLIFSEPVGGAPLNDYKDYGANPVVLRATLDP